MAIVHIAGNLGADPETRFAPSGQKIISLNVAENFRRQGKDETVWWRATMFGDRFDKFVSFLKKGSGVMIVGRLNPLKIWTDKEGRPQVSYELIVETIDFTPSSNRPERSQENAQGGQYTPNQQPAREPAYTQPSYDNPQAGFGSSGSSGAGSFGQGSHQPAQDDDNVPF
jgi:single-strand DNA-binding protein